jgi:CRP/FNR family transcriptional regulator, cyclic AMP receptor protein
MERTPSECAHCVNRFTCVTSGLAPGEMDVVEPAIRRREVRRGHPLSSEGEVAVVVRVLQAGTAFALRRGVDGRSRPVGMATQGEAVGLFGVFGQPTQLSTEAAAAARICEIPVRVLGDVATNNAAFSKYLANAAIQGFGKIAAWSEAIRLRGVANQLAYTLLLLAEAQQEPVIIALPTHSALGELLGTTRESVARGLAVLEEEAGIVRAPGKRCEVRRERLLQRLKNASP